MENSGTAALRSAAPEWTLAGDKQLLDILQNIHQSLMSRCEEVNQKLDEMVTALDDASVDLQNVNNKFMALSNSQFIESRVYDDDADVTVQEPIKESPKAPEPSTELTLLKTSIKVLESMHEVIQILDSDSDSDTDDDVTRTILKPKDAYAHRPLPHIIGSQLWRAKWHAGLLPEDSDTDSSVSEPEDGEEYSDSEPEDVMEDDRTRLRVPDIQDSTTSSEITFDQDPTPAVVVKPSPADVAAELARRLRGSPPKIPESEIEYSNTKSTKVYRPEQPTTATIFSDEPPPLDQNQSEEESQEEDDDIFAELHKSKPYINNNNEQSRLAEDLFSGLSETKIDRGNIFDDYNDNRPTQDVAKQKSTLFDDESEPEMFVDKPSKPTTKPETVGNEPDTVKKPVGGISLFGSNKGAESIGAAILRRNQRKSFSDDDVNEEEPPKAAKKETTPAKTAEKDIFEDLFAKSAKTTKAVNKNESEVVINKSITNKNDNKIDLFSDNLFDDIDDIFTSNVVKTNSTNKNKKSIFDDDDLFADISVPSASIVKEEKRNLFDSDDDLFSEKNEEAKPKVAKTGTNEPERETSSINKSNNSNVISKSKSIFDDDSSDSDIFSKITETKTNYTKNKDTISKENITKESSNITNNKDTVTKDNNLPVNTEVRKTNDRASSNSESVVTSAVRSKPISIFHDDDDENNEIFNSNNKVLHENEKINASKELTQSKLIAEVDKVSIFDDDNDDTDIFTTVNKAEKKNDSILSDNNNKSLKDEEKSELFNDKETDDILSVTSIKQNEIVSNNSHSLVVNDVPSEKAKIALLDENYDESLENNEEKTSNSNNKESNQYKDVSEKITGEKDFRTNIEKQDLNTKGVQNIETKKNNVLDEEEHDLFNNDKLKNLTTEQGHLNLNVDKYKPKLPEPDFDTANTNIDNNGKGTVFPTLIEEISSDIFSDILDEPPAFEKSKELKKSKNINALFDDDSDDEALFFKKNDPTLDDKPDFNTDGNNEALFGLFHDEPPAIDIDFSQKPIENVIKGDVIDDFFEIESKHMETDNFNASQNKDNTPIIDFDDIFKTEPVNDQRNEINIPVSTIDNTRKTTKEIDDNSINSNSDSDLFKPQKPKIELKPNLSKSNLEEQTNKDLKPDKTKHKTAEHSKKEVYDTPDSPSKKIGKLKNMNININVNTLLPGALPKKKSIEQTDGAILSTKSQEDLHSKDKIEPVMVKSVSFDEDPDSQILDNKISKERAKIQVKRRPSTRRARKEAVRKSVIDLGEDSTDNSSSLDEIPKCKERLTNNDPITNEDKVEIKSNSQKASVIKSETTDNFESHPQDNKTDNAIKLDIDSKTVLKHKETIETAKDVKSKIVYILNDEDIFNTNVEKPETTKKSLIITDEDEEDDDLFRNLASGNDNNISTLGNVYKEVTNPVSVTKPKKSLFEDLSDEENELFNSTKKAVTKPKVIQDLDSEDDLFGKKETVTNVKENVKPKVEVKGSLFGDEDDDDLFSAKVKSDSVGPSQPVKPTRDVVTKPSEPVFDDPLSMLAGEQD